jgi:hypothetical protein
MISFTDFRKKLSSGVGKIAEAASSFVRKSNSTFDYDNKFTNLLSQSNFNVFRSKKAVAEKPSFSVSFLPAFKKTFETTSGITGANLLKSVKSGLQERLGGTKFFREAAEGIDIQGGNFGEELTKNLQPAGKLIDFLNSKPGIKFTGKVTEHTESLAVKTTLAIATSPHWIRNFDEGKKVYQKAISDYEKSRDRALSDPETSLAKKFLFQIERSGPQTLLGTLAFMSTTALTRNPVLGSAVAMPFFAALSAEEQRQEKGKIGVTELQNIGIDTIGDTVLGTTLYGLFSKVGSNIGINAIKAFGTEGGTEVAQTLLRYANDFRSAETREEKNSIMEKAKNYVTSGEMALEFGMGGTIGGGISVVSQVSGEAGEAIAEQFEEASKAGTERGFIRIGPDESGIPPELKPLAEEARKFDSVDDFINSQLDFIKNRGYYGIDDTANKLGGRQGDAPGQEILGTIPRGKGQSSPRSLEADRSLLARVVNDSPDGFTINLKGKPVTNGFAFSPYKNREAVLDSVDAKSIDSFLSKNEDLLFQDGHFLGGWRNADDGKFYLDISVVDPNKFRALERALKNDQIAIFDLTKGEELKTVDTLKSQLKAEWDGVRGDKVQPTATLKDVGLQKEPAPFVRKRETTLLKDRIRNIARGAREATSFTKNQIQQVQADLIEILEESNLSPQDRDKFRRAIKNIQTPQQLEEALPEIEQRISSLETKAEKRGLKTDIVKLLKQTKPKKQGNKPVGKFTPGIQNILDKARSALKLTQDEAGAKIGENLDKYKGQITPVEVAVENEILNMVSDMENRTVEELQRTLETLTALVDEGRMINELKKFNVQEEISRAKGVVLESVGGQTEGRQTTGRIRRTALERIRAELKTLGTHFVLDWYGLMQTLDWNMPVTNKRMTRLFSVQAQENKYKELQAGYVFLQNESIAKIFGITREGGVLGEFKFNREVSKKITELSSEEVSLGTFKNRTGQEVEMKMTRGEMMYWWGQLQDPTLKESFEKGNDFTQEIVEAIDNEATDQEKEYVRFVVKSMLRDQYGAVNEVYREINGVDLPFNENYLPVSREGFHIDEDVIFGQLGEDIEFRKALSPSATKSRVQTNLPIKKQNIFEVVDRHFTETNYYTAWAERLRVIAGVFSDSRVQQNIREEFTPALAREINNKIADFVSRGNRAIRSYKSVDWFRRKFTLGALMIKPAIGIKQLVSTVAYLEELGPVEFTEGVADFWSNPIENARILNEESVMIKERGSNIERDIKLAMRTDEFSRFNKLQSWTNLSMLNVRLGDKGAILTGAWAMRKAGLKAGKDLETVIREYENFSSATQQSSDLSRLSAVQTGSAIEKIFTMFLSSPRQYLQKEVLAVQSLFQKGGTDTKNVKKVARVMFIYHVLLPVVFQYIANFGRLDEESRKEYLRSGLLGSINGLFIAGEVVDSVLRTALGLRTFDIDMPIISDIQKEITKVFSNLTEEDITSEDMMDAVEGIAGLGQITGLPTEQALLLTKGFGDILEGDFKKGVAEVLGWSEYSVTGGKKEKEAEALNVDDILKDIGKETESVLDVDQILKDIDKELAL